MRTSREIWEKGIEYKYRSGHVASYGELAEIFQILSELMERIKKLENPEQMAKGKGWL
jgi:hypothetical protein